MQKKYFFNIYGLYDIYYEFNRRGYISVAMYLLIDFNLKLVKLFKIFNGLKYTRENPGFIYSILPELYQRRSCL